MTASDCEIALATVDDIPGIVELQGLNLLSNGGFLSIEFSNDWFERVLSEMPIIVARRDGRIVGYLVSSPVSVAAGAPIIQAKLRAYPGSRNPYNHGPVCIAKEERNQGLISRMFEALRERLGGARRHRVRPARQWGVACGTCETRNAPSCRIHARWRRVCRGCLYRVNHQFLVTRAEDQSGRSPCAIVARLLRQRYSPQQASFRQASAKEPSGARLQMATSWRRQRRSIFAPRLCAKLHEGRDREPGQ